MIDLKKGHQLQKEAFKKRDISVIEDYNAEIVCSGRWKAWLLTNGAGMIEEIFSLRAQVMQFEMRPEPERKKHFNFKTRLQILALLMQDAVRKGTPEAEERFKKALHEHQEIFTDRD